MSAQIDIGAIYYLTAEAVDTIHNTAPNFDWLGIGEDSVVRELAKIALQFETWAYQNVDFDHIEEVWEYETVPRLGALIGAHLVQHEDFPSEEAKLALFRAVAPAGALRNSPLPPSAPRIFITLEGGVVQSVNTDGEGAPVRVVFIDYDDTADESELRPILQPDGSTQHALVYAQLASEPLGAPTRGYVLSHIPISHYRQSH